MPVEKNILERILHHEIPGQSPEQGSQTDMNSQLIKLIEYDEGIPFRIISGNRPGEGRFIFSGNGFKKLTGFDPDTITERQLLENTEEVLSNAGDQPADILELRSDLLTGKSPFYRVNMLVKTADGDKKWIRETAMPLIDENSGKMTGIVGILNDVTCSGKYSGKIEREEENEKLKNTFLQNISHEVRTPLNAIVGFSSLICEQEETYTRRSEIMNLISNSTDNLLHVMDSIIEISSIEAGSTGLNISLVSPHNVMERVYGSSYKKAGEKGLTLRYVCPDRGSDIFMKTDDYKLFQSINNIVSNAIKFTPAEGSIEFGFEIYYSKIEFYINDTGIGIEDHHKPKIFDKFYQAESSITRRYPGIGLGLPISKAYIEMLGGEIRVQSSAASGSSFRFTLPLEL